MALCSNSKPLLRCKPLPIDEANVLCFEYATCLAMSRVGPARSSKPLCSRLAESNSKAFHRLNVTLIVLHAECRGNVRLAPDSVILRSTLKQPVLFYLRYVAYESLVSRLKNFMENHILSFAVLGGDKLALVHYPQ